ncbi:MAG: hypothetical protein A3G32_07325 [Deltaproteobacteria bacterium RIFCSPLOWO2_12_FULL_40_28]|nr:MAG: hypothetical protein A3C45_07370 [Deltaproteobacteria bacterium RIFCSPHIGHO2_02_FULL_40_28]OGQ19234.1 MAG: hypothetical protein A3E27_04445 [Deltaproteobacteria bacterium RIFCSPHIGHO2_12_FULL_40_32]OGQ40542.1 MAG: hypothetical protein A3I69_00625 [Deltaproteobacteria bacterium RIFCSPLOWO2_02_FULL_40_36]OGQ53777.1 MAG: hypothetical protein A3G32_07325 [Deltaproteobacteria bacterium RIFCSPLOWO2_12_FULL_40_28]
MFYRNHLKYLIKWKSSPQRRPLILRGARQVGKTYLVRDFAKKEFSQFIEVNFDHPTIKDLIPLFESTSPKDLIPLLEIHFRTKIIAGQTLLFFDEIQNAPKLIPMLRYFYEDFPELHVIAAGSLLEFVLATHEFSMPIGRIEYLHLAQMTFPEFLLAIDEKPLHDFMLGFSIHKKIPLPFHQRLMDLARLYFVLGGMPEVIKTYTETTDFEACFKIQQNILSTYQDDFHKYHKRVNQNRLRNIFSKLPLMVGQKIKYVNLDPQDQSRPLSEAIDLLCMALVCHRVHHSSCQGVPLRAQINERIFKILFLDVGLLCQSSGLGYIDIKKSEDVNLINQGAITEQFIGQHLLYDHQPYQEPEVFYWLREKRNAAAEIDYVFSENQQIIPVEVKSGKTGQLKSLHVFMKEHPSLRAVRFNGDEPSIYKHDAMTLISLPIYLIGELRRIVNETIS